MSADKYKKYIIEMLEKIDNEVALKRIYNIIHANFIRRGVADERKD